MINKSKTFFYKLISIFLIYSCFFINGYSIVEAQSISDYRIPEPPTYELSIPERSEAPSDAFIIGLSQNSPAPFSGVLYNETANAWLISESERINRLWNLEAQAKLSLLRAWSLRELEQLQNLATQNERALNLRIDSLQQDVVNLQGINDQLSHNVGWSRKEKMALVFTSVGVMVISVVVGYFIGRFAP